MKLLKYITLFAATALMAVSCKNDVEIAEISTPDQFVAPVIGKCSNVVVNADNSKAESVIYTWKPASFGLPVQILYSVYLKSGEVTTLMGTSFSTSFTISKGDLNGVVINGLGMPANTTAKVQAYVTAQMNGTENYDPISSELSESFNVTTYEAALRWYHLCGEFSGWAIDTAPIFWETTGGSNQYSCMVDFTRAEGNEGFTHSYFKVTAEQNWAADNWGYNHLTPSWDCPEQGDSNLSVPLDEGNVFQVTVNTSAMTIDKKNIGNALGVIGSFNDWAGDVALKYDAVESAWLSEPIDFAANAEFKIRVDGSWNTAWGTERVESSKVKGGVEISTSGSKNMLVSEAGVYIVKLHANRTPFVVELIKQ